MCQSEAMNHPVIQIQKGSPQYPERLNQISDAPEYLYCRGNIALLDSECFAVVGTRMLTGYGKEAVQKLIPGLARHFTIVSGLALGIDACVHQTTLHCMGKTIAVLGSGIENITPMTNHRLALEILERDGLLISEHSGKKPAYKDSFPVRNRIISGLSRGVLIIEADEKSGSLVTARHALEQNRDVFAVPGNIFSPKSDGPNKLIQRGAKLVASTEDIIGDYSMLDLKTPVSTENPTEASILAILGTNGPMTTDAIIEQARRDASEITATLSIMEIKGMVRQMAGGMFRKTD